MRSRCRRVGLSSWILLVLGGLLPGAAQAEVRLPALVGDNMVLQQEMAAPIWGWADQGETVTVTILQQKKTAQPDASGKWTIKLDPIPVGGPYTMTIEGKNSITLKNVMSGEVWVASGQSNMSLAVLSANNAKEEIAAAANPQIRLITVPTTGTQEPQQDFKGKWEECSPDSVAHFSAAAYFFGRELQKNINVPIGLIHCSWGGSACEAWVKRPLLEADAEYKPLLDYWANIEKTFDPVKAKETYDKQVVQWKKRVAAAKAAHKEVPRLLPFNNQLAGQHRPANLYNGMLLPLIPYAIRGVIWYQGESNAGRAYQYRKLFALMIESWRADWQEGDFPFYFVQLANFHDAKPEPADSDWAELREAQSMTLNLPNTGQAVIIDIGNPKNIHPTDKQDVGKRLALIALAKNYGKSVEYSGPTYKSMETNGSQIVLHFDHVGGGLVAKGGEGLKGFAVAGADKKFVWGDARIAGDTVVLSSAQVAQPVAVRYAWADNPVCNLYNQADLPASPFRTDDWPGITADVKAPPTLFVKKPAPAKK